MPSWRQVYSRSRLLSRRYTLEDSVTQGDERHRPLALHRVQVHPATQEQSALTSGRLAGRDDLSGKRRAPDLVDRGVDMLHDVEPVVGNAEVSRRRRHARGVGLLHVDARGFGPLPPREPACSLRARSRHRPPQRVIITIGPAWSTIPREPRWAAVVLSSVGTGSGALFLRPLRCRAGDHSGAMHACAPRPHALRARGDMKRCRGVPGRTPLRDNGSNATRSGSQQPRARDHGQGAEVRDVSWSAGDQLLRRAGLPAYAYGPGLVAISHGPNEFVDSSRVIDCAANYARVAATALNRS